MINVFVLKAFFLLVMTFDKMNANDREYRKLRKIHERGPQGSS